MRACRTPGPLVSRPLQQGPAHENAPDPPRAPYRVRAVQRAARGRAPDHGPHADPPRQGSGRRGHYRGQREAGLRARGRKPVPYGVPRGAIVDVAPVSDGHIGRNCVVFADFIPNNWSAWPNTYQHVDILERGPRGSRISAVRDFGTATVTTLYTLDAGADAHLDHHHDENGGSAPMTGLLSGFTLWPSGGFLFPVPGLAGVKEGKAEGALADRVVAYDADSVVDAACPLPRSHRLGLARPVPPAPRSSPERP